MRVQINDPCTANWEKMKISGDGRYCKTCCKTVVDFTQKSTEEIVAYFEANSGQRICGNFRSEYVTIPKQPLRFSILRFAAACWMVFGALLFSSCGEDEKKYTMGEKECIVDSAWIHDSTMMAKEQDSISRISKNKYADTLSGDSVTRNKQ